MLITFLSNYRFNSFIGDFSFEPPRPTNIFYLHNNKRSDIILSISFIIMIMLRLA